VFEFDCRGWAMQRNIETIISSSLFLSPHPSCHKHKHKHKYSCTMSPSMHETMSALFDTLTFNGLQQKPVLSTYCANHKLLEYITSKWQVPKEGILITGGFQSGIDSCVYLRNSEDGSSPDRLVFDGKRNYCHLGKETLFKDLGSPMCLYRLGCTFPSAVHVEQTDKSAWWSTLIHTATGKSFGFDDIKGRVALRFRGQDAYLREFKRKDSKGTSIWQIVRRTKDEETLEDLRTAYWETVPEELVEILSEPETGDPELLKELEELVQKNKVFKNDLMELLNYLASDQCVHGYDDLVAGYEA